MTMETRFRKVFSPNHSKKESAEDTLVPPLWGKRKNISVKLVKLSITNNNHIVGLAHKHQVIREK